MDAELRRKERRRAKARRQHDRFLRRMREDRPAVPTGGAVGALFGLITSGFAGWDPIVCGAIGLVVGAIVVVWAGSVSASQRAKEERYDREQS